MVSLMSVMSPRRAGFDRRTVGQPLSGPRPVIDRGAFVTDQVEPEGEGASGDPRAATGDDRLVERDPGFLEQLAQFLRALQLLGLRIGHLIERQIAAAGDVAAPAPGPGSLGAAIEAASGAGI